MGDLKDPLREVPGPNPTGVLLEKAIEEDSWSAPEKLTGTVVGSLDELRRLIPAGAGEVFLDKTRREGQSFDRYKVEDEGGASFVAYGCPHCHKIVVGAPKIDAVNPKGNPGWQGLEFYCVECNREIGTGGLCSAID